MRRAKLRYTSMITYAKLLKILLKIIMLRVGFRRQKNKYVHVMLVIITKNIIHVTSNKNTFAFGDYLKFVFVLSFKYFIIAMINYNSVCSCTSRIFWLNFFLKYF